MSTSAINPKGPRVYGPGSSPISWAETYLGSSVGQKILTALTGLGLATFVIFHMIGNLKIFSGRESINHYAHFLKHDLGALIWIARGGLLAIFLTHLAVTIRLKLKAVAARPIPYAVQKSAQASVAARSMISTGLVIGAFTVFHLAHFTFAWVHEADLGQGVRSNYLALKDSNGQHDVYSMVVAGFTTPWIAVLYLVAQVAIAVHLSHGIKSSLQTLGLVGRRFTLVAQGLALSVGGVIFLGNVAIVIGVWSGFCPAVYPMAK
jgi:succinate dehydrogenase / fumarate reductase cytochrome b subunit